MYSKFQYIQVPLELIDLDAQNPRIISQGLLANQEAIAEYFFKYEALLPFVRMIAQEGRNAGAERPYLIKAERRYTVIEGNTRIAAYKVLTGQIAVPEDYQAQIPHLKDAVKADLSVVDVAIAPSRESLMPIMARSHFTRGDKNKWRYLGSRKALYSDWQLGKSISFLAQTFEKKKGEIRDYLIEYLLYLECLKLQWTGAEREMLLEPTLEFNPPVRFLQTAGHKQLIGIELDRVNLQIIFTKDDSKSKFQYLIRRMLIDNDRPAGVSSYEDVFAEYADGHEAKSAEQQNQQNQHGQTTVDAADKNAGHSGNSNASTESSSGDQQGSNAGSSAKPNMLFNYNPTRNDLSLRLFMSEAKRLNIKSFPGAGTSLLRSIVELVLKLIIEEKKLNHDGKLLDIEGAANVILGQGRMSADDRNILKEFKKEHIGYLNLSTHATVAPNFTRLLMVRDCIDSFIKRNC